MSIRKRLRGDDGASLVEFALIAPILFLILFGLIDFGFIYNDFLSLRQGVRDGARAGAVANFGTQTSCNNTSATSGITATQTLELLCTARNRIGLDSSKMHVAVCLQASSTSVTNGSTTNGGNCSTSSSDYVDGQELVVCGMYPATSRSGFLNPFLGNGVVTTRVAIRIEQTYAEITNQTSAANNLVSGFETGLPSGKNWNFCVP